LFVCLLFFVALPCLEWEKATTIGKIKHTQRKKKQQEWNEEARMEGNNLSLLPCPLPLVV
jgi:hypothetical protein